MGHVILHGVTEDKPADIALLMLDLKRAEERADKEGWIDAEDLEKELDIRKREQSWETNTMNTQPLQ